MLPLRLHRAPFPLAASRRSAAKRRAVAAPIPVPPPLTIATLPSSRLIYAPPSDAASLRALRLAVDRCLRLRLAQHPDDYRPERPVLLAVD
jgi:hypothetical protein